MVTTQKLRGELKKLADPKRAQNLQRFFKTGKGEYGEGDVFLGITVPQLRKIAKKYYSLDMKDLSELIKSKFHEERMVCLFILINKYKTTNHKKIIFHFYLKNTKYINNWDLVDLSAPNIVGAFLGSTRSLNDSSEPSGNTSIAYKNKSKMSAKEFYKPSLEERVKSSFREGSHPNFILVELAKSKNLWERRIAVLSTFYFIKNNQFEESLKLAEILLQDKHDLMRKAVGWMLREVGKKDLKKEIDFLNKHYQKMPRTMLRYAIERFPEKLRKAYLLKKINFDLKISFHV